MATTYLTRTPSTAGNRETWTMSMWTKISSVGTLMPLFNSSSDANNYDLIFIEDSNQLRWWSYQSSSFVVNLRTSRLFRDTSAYYHLVFVYDSGNATADDRIKLYVNGVQETSFSTRVNPSQNANSLWNSTLEKNIGRDGTSGGYSDKFNGSMSHVHFIDGTAYDATAFGEYDANGVWKIIASPSVTYGTNGFFILKNGNSVTDQSPNTNNFTVGGGTLTNTEDSPSNVFATWNSLDNYYPAMTLSYGNTRALTITNKYTYIPTTLGMTSGKYYAEIKCTAQSSSQEAFLIGISSTSSTGTTQQLGEYANDYSYYASNGNYRNNDTNTSYGSAFTTGDIIGIAVDLDNNKLYFRKNNDAWNNSGDPTSGATGTGAISITDPTSTPRGAYFFAVCYWSSTNNGTFDANFGNGYFGTTAVASAGTNASGIGIFEYDVPTGFTALSTKGLNL